MKVPVDVVTLTLLDGAGFTSRENFVEIKFNDSLVKSKIIVGPSPHFFESFVFSCAGADQEDRIVFTVYGKSKDNGWEKWAQEGIPLKSFYANKGTAQSYVIKPVGARLKARKQEGEEYSVYDCEISLLAYFPVKKEGSGSARL